MGYQGFFHLKDITSDVVYARLEYLIRDFDKDDFNNRKEVIKTIVNILNKKYNN